MLSQNGRGLSSILLASFLFGLMAFWVKVLSTAIPAAEILFFRALFGIALILAVAAFQHRNFKVNNGNMLFARGLFGGMAVLLYFIAISRIPLSSAAMLSNAYPLFAALFSAILIRERPSFATVLILLIAFGGMYMILDPHFGNFDVGYLMALASAVFGGIAVTCIRELRKTDSSWVIVFSQMLGAALFCLLPVSTNFRVPNFNQWELLVLVGIVGTVGQIAFTRPFKYIHAPEGSIVALASAAFTVLFSILFLNEVLSIQFVIGAMLVFGGSLYLIAREEGWTARVHL